mgnify:CR=1 FL=1
MPLSILLPLILQVGPGGALPQAPLQIPSKKKSEAVVAAPQTDLLKECLQLAMTRPSDAIEVAEGWLAKATTMRDRAGARQCHALALTRIDGWAEAALAVNPQAIILVHGGPVDWFAPYGWRVLGTEQGSDWSPAAQRSDECAPVPAPDDAQPGREHVPHRRHRL